MIKLKTDLDDLRRLYEDYRNLDGWEKETHSALVAHAYQEARKEWGKMNPTLGAIDWTENRAAELLKSWGVES